MKIRNILALVALSCMLIFASCKKEEGGIPDHLKIIPANSMAVMTINAKELVKKGGLDSYKDFELYKKMHQELSRYEPEATKFMDEFLKDTRVSGLNLDQVFMYYQHLGKYDELVVFSCGVDNSDKVAKWISKYHEVTKEDEYELVKGDGYNAYRLNYGSILVWDKSKAVLLTISESDEEDYPGFESFLRIDESNSIVSNADFMASYNTQKDFTIWMSFKKIMEMNDGDQELSTLSKLYGEEWENGSMDFALNFTNEKAALSVSVWPVSLVEKFQKEYPILKADFDESLLRYFPENYFLAMKASFNVQEYYKVVVDKLAELTKSLEGQAEDDEDDEYNYNYNPFGDHEYMSNLLSIVDNENVAKIVNCFKGDIIADIFGFQEGMNPMPQFGVAVTINGEESFNHLLGLLPTEIKLNKIDSYYSYDIPQVMTIYAGQKGDVMYITNTKEGIDNFYAQGYKENLSSSSIVDYMKASPILYSLNADISSYPAMATTILQQSMGRMEYGIFSNFMEPFSSINIMQTETNSGELNLILKDKKENSLKVIFKAIDSYAVKYFMMGF